MDDLSTNPLMQRVLRFITHHSERYRQHRENGEYGAAIASLRQISRYLRIVDQAEKVGKSQLSWNDWATVQLARRHVDMVFNSPPDGPNLLGERLIDFRLWGGGGASIAARNRPV